MLGAEVWYKARSVMRAHKIWRYCKKFIRPGDLAPGMYAPLNEALSQAYES